MEKAGRDGDLKVEGPWPVPASAGTAGKHPGVASGVAGVPLGVAGVAPHVGVGVRLRACGV